MIHRTLTKYIMTGLFLVALGVLPAMPLYGNEIQHEPGFRVPEGFFEDPAFQPVEYLASYPVTDANTLLDSSEKEQLVFLFLSAAQACETKQGSHTALQTCSPVYLLLKENFPNIAFVEKDQGRVVYLADIAGPLSDYVGP